MTAMTEQEAIRVLRDTLKQIADLSDNEVVFGHAQRCARAAFNATAIIQPVAAPEKIAPVQGYTPGIPWSLHLEAYDAYRKRYGSQQALIEGGCRGGFGVGELDMFIPGWRDKVSEVGRLKARIAELEAAAPAQAAPADEAKDAARYRWLKMTSSPGEQRNLLSTHWGRWDDTIDAAIAAKEGKA